jgi:hypothetical protein
MPGDMTGLPCSWEGNKYRNLALQVMGVSKIETIKYAYDFYSHSTGMTICNTTE